MTTLDLTSFIHIPQREKDLINGFIREIQKIFPEDVPFYNIPISINKICGVFYQLYNDKWDKKYIGVNHRLSQDGYRIEHIKSYQNTSYGSLIVKSPGIYRWGFKLHHTCHLTKDNYWAVVLGVWKTKSAEEPLTKKAFSTNAHGKGHYEWGYAFDAIPGVLIKPAGWISNGGKYGKRCTVGDVIEIELDLNQFVLKYRINNKDMGNAFENIEDTEYRVACSTVKIGMIVEMLH